MYNEKKITFIVDIFYYLIWVAIIYFLLKVVSIYLFPFVVGILIAYSVQRPANFLSKKIKIKKEICAALLSVLIFLIFFAFIALIIWLIYSQSQSVMKSSNELLTITKDIENSILLIMEKLGGSDTISFKNIISQTLNGFTQKIGNFISSFFASILRKIPSFAITFIITIVSTCYISKDFANICSFFSGFLKEKTVRNLVKFKAFIIDTFKCFSVGYFWLFLLTFFEVLLGLTILNVSNVIVVTFVIAVVDLLPVFGTGVVLLPWSVIEILNYNYSKGIGLLVLYLIVVIVRNFIEPKIIGKQIGINPLFTLIFIFVGLKFGGVIGMILFPLICTVAFNYLRHQYMLNNENV